MEAPTTRILGPARIVALALLALLVLGLAYLRFGREAGSISVPAGARAGELTLKPCRYATEKGDYRADCGTLVVPENRSDPRSRLIALPVTRIRARSPHPGEPIFRLEGGPGITNMKFSKASRIAGNHDVVLVGYRGVDGSVRLDCPEVASALKHSADVLGQKSFRAYTQAFRACAARLRADGVDLAGYSIPAQVDDLEAARKALGYGRIDLVSESAGTRTAMIYSWRYPKSIYRSVMIGVNPPGHFLWEPKTTDTQIRAYAELCSKDTTCSKRTDDLAASMRRTASQIPDRLWFLPISRGNVRNASFYGLMESSSEAAPLSAPMTLGSWLSAAAGDPSGFWFMSVVGKMAFPESFVWGELAAMARSDTLAATRYFASGPHRSDSILGNPGTEFLYAGGGLVHAWPATPDENEYASVRDSKVETLLVGGTLDFATPAVIATRELLPHLRNGHQVLLPNVGHTTSFWSYEPEASMRLLNGFLDSGKVDRSLYTPATIDFTPDVTQTALGKGFALGMIAFAALTVLSLLLMWRRVHRRGGFGRKASAILRSLYPIVLGLGGWFGGALIALTTMPDVPLDDELLTALSVGVPVGLGIYFAWVRRNLPAGIKTAGFSAAVAGALVGGWLGFNATAGLLALSTTIVGALAGANLTLLALDISANRPARDPSPAASSRPASSSARGDASPDPGVGAAAVR
jgi:pimeloyl-ACP methyl ester carboxylesterase